MSKPLLLGMNNPLHDDPKFDLYPYPEGSAGWRLWKLSGLSRGEYLEAFDRRNLLRARAWSAREAREVAREILPELRERVVVVLGAGVRTALGFPPADPLVMYRTTLPAGPDGIVHIDWALLPHPSGRNRWYNDPENESAARDFLADMAAVPIVAGESA